MFWGKGSRRRGHIIVTNATSASMSNPTGASNLSDRMIVVIGGLLSMTYLRADVKDWSGAHDPTAMLSQTCRAS